MKEALEGAGLPRIYFFPADGKSTPYTQFSGFPNTESLLRFVKENAFNDIKIKESRIEGLGSRDKDQELLQKLVTDEAVIVSRAANDDEKTKKYEEL